MNGKTTQTWKWKNTIGMARDANRIKENRKFKETGTGKSDTLQEEYKRYRIIGMLAREREEKRNNA